MNLFEPRREGNVSRISTPEGVDPITELPSYEDLTRGFQPSDEQRRVFGFVDQGDGNAIVEAVAGSGKTETLLGCARLIDNSKRCLVCAFNASVQKELEEKLNSTSVRVETLHSLGRSMLEGSIGVEFGRPERWKMRNIVEKTIEQEMGAETRENANVPNVTRLCRRVKQTLTDAYDSGQLRALAEYYGEEWKGFYAEIVKKAIKKSNEAALSQGTISFDDMIYVPIQKRSIRAHYDWVLVDEAQDLNSAQRKMVREVCKEDGRKLYVGDRDQAINGFQGADPRSIDHIKEKTGAIEIALNTCYRCPKRHISKAQGYVPEIRPADWAEEGTLAERSLDELPSLVEEASEERSPDLVLCRTNKPLIKWCLRTVVEWGKPAYVEGKNTSEKLIEVVEEAERRAPGSGPSKEVFREGLDRCKKNASVIAEETISEVEEIERRIDLVRQIIRVEGWKNVDSLKRRIEKLFEKKPGAIKFSTVHRAKGQEADRVFCIRPSMTIIGPEDPDWQAEQEENLKYVMLTRSTNVMVLCKDEEVEAEGKIEASTEKTFMQVIEEDLSPGDRFEHPEHGRGEVVTTEEATEGSVVMRFGSADQKYREVPIDEPLFRKV